MSSFLNRIDGAFAQTRVSKFFEVSERGSTLSTEVRGALATFMSMAYILAVNPRILADSGATCNPAEGSSIVSEEYEDCLEQVKRQFITSTAIASMIGCLLMGFMANLPIALAPGMGMNAYFTYSVVGWRGTGDISYKAATTAVLIEGIIFLFLAVTGIRFAIVRLVPEPVRLATPAAIGAFLAHLGLQTAEGIGMVVADTATIVTLGGCPEDKRTRLVAWTEACQADVTACIPGDAYTCDVEGGIMRSPTIWMGLLGLMIMLILLAYKKRSAFIIGIGFVTFLSWFRNTEITYFPDTVDGNDRFDFFKKVVSVEGVDKILAPYTGELSDVGVALVTFLYVDFLDTSGTLLAIASSMGYVDEEGNFPRSRAAFAADALATTFGSILGLSPVTSYIESGAGVQAGSRTGLTAIVCGFLFFLSIFFAPIIASIPPWATGGALIITGALMARSLAYVKWYDITHASTAFLTVMVMPLTYSIAYGLLAGISCWIVLQSTFTVLEKVAGIERPVFYNPDDDDNNVQNAAAAAAAANNPDKTKALENAMESSSEGEGDSHNIMKAEDQSGEAEMQNDDEESA